MYIHILHIHAPRVQKGCGYLQTERSAEPPGSGRPRGARRCTQPAAGTVSAAGRSWLDPPALKRPSPVFEDHPAESRRGSGSSAEPRLGVATGGPGRGERGARRCTATLTFLGTGCAWHWEPRRGRW